VVSRIDGHAANLEGGLILETVFQGGRAANDFPVFDGSQVDGFGVVVPGKDRRLARQARTQYAVTKVDDLFGRDALN
jgi:hypothetical protein